MPWSPLKLFKLANLKAADPVFRFLPVEVSKGVSLHFLPASTTGLILVLLRLVPAPPPLHGMSSFLVT